MKLLQPPLLWLLDMNVSALKAKCSAEQGVEDAGKEISQMVQISQQPSPWSPLSAAASGFELGSSSSALSSLLSTLQICGGAPSFTPRAPDIAQTLAVPPTHLRLISFDGFLLIPAQGVHNSSSLSSSVETTRQVLTSAGKFTAFKGPDVEALLIVPNTFFQLAIQLYDGLDQPVAVGACSSVLHNPLGMHG